MAKNSSIEWTQLTWNPVTGCTKISQGCKFCYAERMAKRLQAMGVDQYRNGFELSLAPQALTMPYNLLKKNARNERFRSSSNSGVTLLSMKCQTILPRKKDIHITPRAGVS